MERCVLVLCAQVKDLQPSTLLESKSSSKEAKKESNLKDERTYHEGAEWVFVGRTRRVPVVELAHCVVVRVTMEALGLLDKA